MIQGLRVKIKFWSIIVENNKIFFSIYIQFVQKWSKFKVLDIKFNISKMYVDLVLNFEDVRVVWFRFGCKVNY